MTSDAHTRRAGAEDARLLARLHADIFPDDPWNVGWMGKLMANPANHGMVLTVEQTAAGLALASLAAGEAEILTIGVVPAARCQGHGALLLDDLVRHLHRGGAARLFLEVSARNIAALALYEKAGFARTGLRHKYYHDGSDAVTMARALD